MILSLLALGETCFRIKENLVFVGILNMNEKMILPTADLNIQNLYFINQVLDAEDRIVQQIRDYDGKFIAVNRNLPGNDDIPLHFDTK